MSSEPKTGALLQVLAATKPTGAFLEIGTGTDLSAAWILLGMDQGLSLLTVDNDPKSQVIAQKHLGHDKRMEFICCGAGQ